VWLSRQIEHINVLFSEILRSYRGVLLRRSRKEKGSDFLAPLKKNREDFKATGNSSLFLFACPPNKSIEQLTSAYKGQKG
jgi:hypothetical protein